MGDQIQLTSTFKIVGKNVGNSVTTIDPQKIELSLPELKFGDITFSPPEFSPVFSPIFSPQITLDPKYEIRVEPTPPLPAPQVKVEVHPTPLEVLNKIEVPEFQPIVVESYIVAPWKALTIILLTQVLILVGSLWTLLHFYSMGMFD